MKVYLAWHIYTYEYDQLLGVYSNEKKAVKAVEKHLSKNINQSGFLLNNKRVNTLDFGSHLWSDKEEGQNPFEYAVVDKWDVE